MCVLLSGYITYEDLIVRPIHPGTKVSSWKATTLCTFVDLARGQQELWLIADLANDYVISNVRILLSKCQKKTCCKFRFQVR